jgi:predicted MFS family arabinose efflux permease
VLPLLAYGSGLYVLVRAANSLLYDPVLSANGFALDRLGSVSVGMALAGALAAHYSARFMARGERTLLKVLPLMALASYVGLSWTHGPFIVAAMCLQGPVMSVLSIVAPVALHREVESSAHRATVLSLQSVAWRGSYALAAPIIGWALDVLSLQAALLSTAAIGASLLSAALVLTHRRRGT